MAKIQMIQTVFSISKFEISNLFRASDLEFAFLGQRIGKIFFPQHSPFPGGDLRDHIGQQPQGIVGGQDGNAQHVSHGDENKEVLHTRPCLHGKSG
jgi:hypothetical protein